MLLDYPPQSALGVSLKCPENSLDEDARLIQAEQCPLFLNAADILTVSIHLTATFKQQFGLKYRFHNPRRYNGQAICRSELRLSQHSTHSKIPSMSELCVV